jgi:hypothetical protein
MYTHTNTRRARAHTHARTRTRAHPRAHTHTQARAHTHTHTHTHKLARTQAPPCKNSNTHTRARAHTHTHRAHHARARTHARTPRTHARAHGERGQVCVKKQLTPTETLIATCGASGPTTAAPTTGPTTAAPTQNGTAAPTAAASGAARFGSVHARAFTRTVCGRAIGGGRRGLGRRRGCGRERTGAPVRCPWAPPTACVPRGAGASVQSPAQSRGSYALWLVGRPPLAGTVRVMGTRVLVTEDLWVRQGTAGCAGTSRTRSARYPLPSRCQRPASTPY